MKSLEHIIREIREGKTEKGDKKTLEGSIRTVMRRESSFAAKDSKPVDEGTDHSVYHVSWGPGLDHEVVAKHGEEAISKAKNALVLKTPKLKDPKYSDTFNKKPTVHNISKERNVQKEDIGGLAGSGTGGEPKLHTEDGKKKKDVKEAIGTLGTDKYQGNEFKSIRSATPHIKPPGPEHGHSQAPENASRQRSIAKEKAGINRVTEQAALALPAIGAGLAAGAYLLSPKGKVKIPTSSGAPDIVDKFLYPSAEELARAEKAIKAGTKTKPKPKHDEPVPGEIPDPSKPVEPKKAPEKPAEEKPKAPPVTVPAPKPVEVPQEPPAKAIPAPQTPKPTELPPPLPAQTRPGKEKTTPKTPAPVTPTELPKKWKEVGPPMPAETRPAAEPATKTDVQTKPRVAQLPAIDIGTKTKVAADTKTATQTAAVPAAATPKSAADTKTATPAEKKDFPSFGIFNIPHQFDYTASHLFRPKVSAGHAKAHKKHATMREAIDVAVERNKIENMPRKGDRKTIEYVGRKESDPKTSKEKTSRLATIKNVIDEAKKEVAKKTNYEDGKTKVFDYGKDILIINPDQKRVDLDVEGNKISKDYDNK